jgi:hypothetical protein
MKILIRDRWRNPEVGFVTFLALVVTIAACACSGSWDKQQSGTKSQSPASEHLGAIDACGLITQDDASTLFGKPANRDKGTPVIDPNMLGECLWSWEAETGNQLLQFRIWQGTQYYGPTPDSQPFDLGENGYIRAHRVSGVDVEWVQEGRTISVSYSTVGPGTPDPLTRIEEIKQLARKAAAQLSRA